MANQLKMADQQAIIALAGHGWSFRRIADELGVHRETVARYVRLSQEAPKPEVPPPELEVPPPEPDSKPAIPITGGEEMAPTRRILTTSAPSTPIRGRIAKVHGNSGCIITVGSAHSVCPGM